MRSFLTNSISLLLAAGLTINPTLTQAAQEPSATPAAVTTPIQHLVIIFGENISFDHYFGTYPKALNPPGQPPFTAAANTPSVNGLTNALLTNNPNLNPANGSGASNPFRLDRSQALTADMNHNYGPEQSASNNGAMDLFPQFVGTAGAPPNYYPPVVFTKGLVMGYYDGNTVTGMWNYAQHFALNDNTFTSSFGPSTPGLINLVSGQTNGIVADKNGPASSSFAISDGNGGLTLVGDADPLNDVCSAPTRYQAQMGGKNVGDLLSAAGVTWGSFMGGFNLQTVNTNGTTGCNRSTVSPVTHNTVADYVPHHAFFQYHASTSNPNHTPPTSPLTVGLSSDPANHNYDINDFYAAVSAGNFPAVSFLKAPAYQDGHPGNSNPLDEQTFVVHVVNFLQQQSAWSNTAVVVLYDDSDGWYDHQAPTIINGSATSIDTYTSAGVCGNGATALPGINPATAHAQGRCGYATRIPLLVISPFAVPNSVDHTLLDQSSVTRFIEDNWLGGQRIGGGSFDAIAGSMSNMFNFNQTPNAKLVLNETTGVVVP